MGYFDDLQLLNVTQVRNYGVSETELILTPHYYLGVICGELLLEETVESRPMVYLTPKGILTPNGWNSPPRARRDNFYIEITGERAKRFFCSLRGRKEVPSLFCC